MAHDPGFSFVSLFYGLQLSPEILYFHISLEYRLVSASSKSQIKSCVCVLFCLNRSLSSGPHAYAEAHRKICRSLYRSDLIQYVELGHDYIVQVLLFKRSYIRIVSHLIYGSFYLFCPASYYPIYLTWDSDPVLRRGVGYKLIVVIYLYLGKA